MAHDARPHKLLKIVTASGGPGQTLATSESMTVPPNGLVSVQCVVDDGNGAVPTDSPSGVLKMYATATGGPTGQFSPVTKADADLLAISPIGNNALVSGWASFECTPGVAIKIVYSYTSGGGTGSRIQVRVVG